MTVGLRLGLAFVSYWAVVAGNSLAFSYSFGNEPAPTPAAETVSALSVACWVALCVYLALPRLAPWNQRSPEHVEKWAAEAGIELVECRRRFQWMGRHNVTLFDITWRDGERTREGVVEVTGLLRRRVSPTTHGRG